MSHAIPIYIGSAQIGATNSADGVLTRKQTII
jgi:hypothetical protein